MNSKVIILGARPYDFEDQQTKKQVSGVSVWVYPMEERADGVNGVLPVKYSLTKEQYASIAQVQLPVTATLCLGYSVSTKKVTFEKFENLKPLVLN